MKHKRTLIVLLLALLSGSLAGVSTLRYVRSRPAMAANPAAAGGGTQVVIATRDMPVGTVLGPNDVSVIRWPDRAVPEGYARTVPEVVGRGVITAVRRNEPLLATKLADKAAGGGLPIVIPEGMRAVSIRVDEVVGVAGFVLPSTRVDVLLTIAPDKQDPVTQVILQNMQVLAAGQTIQRDEQGKPMTVTVITLLADPQQAEKLVLASAQGRIQLALRNTLDMKTPPTPGVRVPMLLQVAAEPSSSGRRIVRSSQAATPKSERIEVFRGAVKTLNSF